MTQPSASAGTQAAELAKAKASDRLARATQAINAVRNMQNGAASALTAPDGLTPGGLQRATGVNARWDGAQAPVQSGGVVTIKQTDPQAVLHWQTFNVGRNTTLRFDQSGGGADAGQWIAFNKVFDAITHAYGTFIGRLVRVSSIVMFVYLGLLFLTGYGFVSVPTGFIPSQDQGYLVVDATLPDAASLERTQDLMGHLEKIAREDPGVGHTITPEMRADLWAELQKALPLAK